jgi:putative Holliday junction resolvase
MAKILAIDFGTRKSGLATSDENQVFANKLGIIQSSNIKIFLKEIKVIISTHSISKILIGLPDEKDFFGKNSGVYGKIITTGRLLEEKFKIEVEFWNESMTTILARENSRKSHVDDESARIILQEYLDFKN